MKNNITKLMLIGFLVLPLAVALPTQAATTWDATGDYVVNMEYLGTEYPHDMSLVQDSLGNLTGGGGHPAGGPHTFTWTITSGTVAGDIIHITADYTLGAIGTTMHIEGTIAGDGTMSGTWDDNFGGGTRVGTWSTVSGAALVGALSAEDFGVVDYDTGLGQLRGYTSGFGLTDADLSDVTSIIVKLYSGLTLLQTNTATALVFGLPGDSFSSPFDVSGDFDYVADGYWTNVREAEYGQSVPATRVVASVVLENGKVLSAENTVLVGDPTTIYPDVVPVPDPENPANKDECKNGGWEDFGFMNQGQCVRFVETDKDSR